MSFSLKLDRIGDRAAELSALLSEGLSGDAYVKASREVVRTRSRWWRGWRNCAPPNALPPRPSNCSPTRRMRDLAEAELAELKGRIPELRQALRIALLPKDEADARSAILEVRPGRRW